jgi:hypothetical protein
MGVRVFVGDGAAVELIDVEDGVAVLAPPPIGGEGVGVGVLVASMVSVSLAVVVAVGCGPPAFVPPVVAVPVTAVAAACVGVAFASGSVEDDSPPGKEVGVAESSASSVASL